jgi:demethylmenaquinone methyltransferase/2-methoxy-6-polyprenyl-1,4-benzoquinol methylase
MRLVTNVPEPQAVPVNGYEHRKPLSHVVARYDRVARFYSVFEPLFLIFPPARRRAVAALELAPGQSVIELCVGTGRNLDLLVAAVGLQGRVVGVDASRGMLAQAQRLVERRGWRNVTLLQQDVRELDVEGDFDGVLFSLSYSVIPDPRPALARAWAVLVPGGRLAVMDLGFTQARLARLLDPVAKLLQQLGPGDAYSEPWKDLAEYAPVEMERFLLRLYYVCRIRKPF